MPWEQRKGKSYYYRKRRIGDRVVSEYVGASIAAELRSAYDELGKALRLNEREGQKACVDLVEGIDASLDAFDEAVGACCELMLYALGFHRHKSSWRRARIATKPTKPPSGRLMPLTSPTDE